MPVALVNYKDQMDYVISVPQQLKRIVSLVPSQTEFLCDLGLENQIVGITKFCIHPNSCYQTKVRVGGTKDFNFETIKLLQPDIIIANKEENEKDLLFKLKQKYPVWISDIINLEQSLDMMFRLGEMFQKKQEAASIVNQIADQFSALKPLTQSKRVAYFIWRKPYMSVNKDTFIHDMLQRCGFENCFAMSSTRYPSVTAEDLKAADPEIIFLSSEPYPFQQKHFEEIRNVCPQARIFLVNGEMFSWYGSRLSKSPAYFNKLCDKIQSQ